MEIFFVFIGVLRIAMFHSSFDIELLMVDQKVKLKSQIAMML